MAQTDGLPAANERRAPGVEIRSFVPEPPAAFRTGVPVFVGFVEDDDETADRPDVTWDVLTRWDEFEQRLSPRSAQSPNSHGGKLKGFLPYAVRGFFENGGSQCFVVAIKTPGEAGGGVLSGKLKRVFGKDANGLRGILEDIRQADLVCVPDIVMSEIAEDRQRVLDLQADVLEYCSDMGDRFAILDSLPRHEHQYGVPATVTSADIELVSRHWSDLASADAALYFPWIRVAPIGRSSRDHGRESGRTVTEQAAFVPPCGHIAGIYARSDADFGVHKAPANEIVEGASDLQVHVSRDAQAELNDVGVNCLRIFPGRGIRVWGARTLSGLPQWRYVNVRRLFITLMRWIETNMADIPFEPNGPRLWDRVRNRLIVYCDELFTRGALKGLQPEEAFFVKCDGETNPLEEREAGKLVCHIGLAPNAPAEFITVRVVQTVSGVAMTSPAAF